LNLQLPHLYRPSKAITLPSLILVSVQQRISLTTRLEPKNSIHTMSNHEEQLQNVINALFGRPAQGYGGALQAPPPTPTYPPWDLTDAQLVVIPEAEIPRLDAGFPPAIPYEVIPQARPLAWVNPPGTPGMAIPPSAPPSWAIATPYPASAPPRALPAPRPVYVPDNRVSPSGSHDNAGRGGAVVGPKKTCFICREEIPAAQRARLLGCGHDNFCVPCIRHLPMGVSGQEKDCPMCGKSFLYFGAPGGIYNA
jgi:hypothetical protein